MNLKVNNMADETIDKKALFEKYANLMYAFGNKLLIEIEAHNDADETYVHMFMTHGSVIGVLYAYEAVFGKDENYYPLKEECDRIVRDTRTAFTITYPFGDGDDD